MFDKCVLFNLHASKPVWAGCVSSLYYIIQNIFLCSIIQNVYTFANKIYIHIHIKIPLVSLINQSITYKVIVEKSFNSNILTIIYVKQFYTM